CLQDAPTRALHPLSLHDALPIFRDAGRVSVAETEDGLDALDAAAVELEERRQPDRRAPEPLAIHQVLAEHCLAQDVQAGPEEVAPLAVQRDGHALQLTARAGERSTARLPVAAREAEARRRAGEPVLDAAG